MPETGIVHLVDDDPAVRDSLSLTLQIAGYEVRLYPSAAAFLTDCDGEPEGCLLLDLRMPEMDGLALQQALKHRGFEIPVIFISANGSIPATVAAVREGALDFLEKPFSVQSLIERVEEALAVDRRRRRGRSEGRAVRQRWASLTGREREVMDLVTEGLSNKEVARVLGISPRTVENHRAQVMEKMGAENLPELCRLGAMCRNDLD